MKFDQKELNLIKRISQELNCTWAEAKMIMLLEGISYRMYLLTKEKEEKRKV